MARPSPVSWLRERGGRLIGRGEPARRARARRVALAVLLLLAAFFLVPIPRIDSPRSRVLVDADGNLAGATVAADEQWRFPGTGRVPEKYARAVVRYEDRRFWGHPGVDPLAVARAVRLNVARGGVVSGASTLTMQVVRIARGNPPRTVGEKAIEAVLALRLEAADSKEEILSAYAENAPFGGNTVGIEAAAWRYFGHTPDRLSWAEAATLAVLPNSPALIHPGRNRDALRAKRNDLLRDLAADGALDAVDLDAALQEPIPDTLTPIPHDAPHLLAKSRGDRLATTLDADLQARARAVVEQHARALSGQGIQHAAALVVELESGRVLAYVGNVTPSALPGSHVDVVTQPRSTGSLLKPLLYASALGDGTLLPRQLLPDIPARLGGWTPENFDHNWTGAIPAATALARSRNVPAVWMLRDYGAERFTARLRRMGMTTLFRTADQYGLSLVIGGAEGSLWELTGLYRDLALTVTHPGGELPAAMHWRADAPTASRPAVLDAGAAWLTLQALDEVARPGVESQWRQFRGAQSVSWKTGTSQGFRDGWAIGVTLTHAVGVWVGNADGEGRAGLTGYQAAAPLLFDLFDLVRTSAGFVAPTAQLAPVRVCAHSGMLASPDCPDTEMIEAPRAAEHGPGCDRCTLVQCANGCTERVDASCARLDEMETRAWFTLPPAQEVYYARQHPEYRRLPPLRAGCSEGDGGPGPLAIVSPAPGAQLFIPVEVSGERGRVVFDASHRDRGAVLYWHLDTEFVGATTAPHQLAVAPPPGPHTLTIVDPDGHRATRAFTVIGTAAER
jgi:penicillin-binding protein 1C